MADQKDTKQEHPAARPAEAPSPEAQQARRQREAQGPTPSNLAGIAATIDPELVFAPPAAIGRGVSEASDRLTMEDQVRRLERTRPGSVGLTAGPAEETSGLVKIRKVGDDQVVECPNCNRRWPNAPRYRGSTIPCVCGYLLNVPAE